ncbi:MAG: hypothetical protein EOM80_13895 [Erysipelotrichia bacterium]|nr:hypothetical protein [Erysipelotrichia bacterium]
MQTDSASLLEMFRTELNNLERPSLNNLKFVAGYRLTLWQQQKSIMCPIKDNWRNAFIEAAGELNAEVAAAAFDSAWLELYGRPGLNDRAAISDICYLDAESMLIETEAVFEAVEYTAKDVIYLVSGGDSNRKELTAKCVILEALSWAFRRIDESYRQKFGLT